MKNTPLHTCGSSGCPGSMSATQRGDDASSANVPRLVDFPGLRVEKWNPDCDPEANAVRLFLFAVRQTSAKLTRYLVLAQQYANTGIVQ